MNRFKNLKVLLNGISIGTLAVMKEGTIAFEYDSDWLVQGFPISPLSLPLEKKVFIPRPDPFDGLFGVFADSLPDGWGRLLVDRMLRKYQIDPFAVDSLNRLAIVGETGMGALQYSPVHMVTVGGDTSDYDKLAAECRKILQTDESEDIDVLFALGGSSGGARPKILTEIEGEKWIVKFPSSADKKDTGKMEYQYSLCARACGVEVPDTKLLPSKYCEGYFGVKRFDRCKKDNGREKRIHMISVSAMLETTHRLPNLDYHDLMKLTYIVTKDYQETEKMFRLMCFNVFAHNRDDHSRNFSFLYDQENKRWRLSPAYDLTYSYSLGGEHATCINGNGKNPGMSDILAVADKAGIKRQAAVSIAESVQAAVKDFDILSFGVSK